MSAHVPRLSTRLRVTSRWVGVLAMALLLCSAPVASAVSLGAPVDTVGTTAYQVEGNGTGGTTNESDSGRVRHRDPRGLVEDSELPELEETLAALLSRQLNQSSRLIDRRQYDQARSLLGEEYTSLLGRYVRVASETPATADYSAEFATVRDEQRAFADTADEYRETRKVYDDAKEDGDEAGARELARELNVLATAIMERGERVGRAYDSLGAASGQNFSAAKESISSVQRAIATEQATISEAEFVETELELLAVDPEGSYLAPVNITGRITDENGLVLANRTVEIEVNDTDYEVRTDATGEFTLAHRPVTARLGPQRIPVQYVPEFETAYLGSNATASVTIAQVEPSLTLGGTPTTVRFGSDVELSGNLTVAGQPAAGVPLEVRVGDVVVGRTVTAATGGFGFDGALPATVPTGDRQLVVAYPFEDRAFAPVSTEQTVSVRTTRTTISVGAEQTAPESIVVTGRLTTFGGEPVPRQSVSVRVDGVPVGTLETKNSGRFSRVVRIPESSERSVAVVVNFEGVGTNLEPSEGRSRVSLLDAALPGAGAGGGVRGPAGPMGWLLVTLAGSAATAELFGVSLLGLADSLWFDVAVVLGVFGGALLVRTLHRRRTPVPLRVSTSGSETEGPTGATGVASVADVALPVVLAELAQDRLDDAPRFAVEYAYLAARVELAGLLDLPERLTHREFAAACTDRLEPAAAEPFRSLTDRYERALFTTGELSGEEAAAAVTEARTVLEQAPTEPGSPAPTTRRPDPERRRGYGT